MSSSPSKIRFMWDDESKTAIRAEYDPGWTWDEYHQVVGELADFLKGVDQSVPYINVYHPGARLPLGSPVPHLNRMSRTIPQNIIILVSTDPVNIREITVFAKTIGYSHKEDNFFIVPDLGAARKVVVRYWEKKKVKGQ